ncbi:DRC2 protein, partial [Rhinopomastus cyanomelas]|nr:DRC2 protein [Rhinopomastus cyanomelas]
AAPVGEEDELQLLQSQALAQDGAAKMKWQLLNQFMKDRLAKENHNSTLSLQMLHSKWQRVLREAKAKKLHQDVEILSQTFARVIDCKNSVIESLVADLEQAEEQHSRALGSHLHNMDRLLEIQRSRLKCLEEGYNSLLEALKLEFEAERYKSLRLRRGDGQQWHPLAVL